MPYFQRKPVEGLTDIFRTPGAIPGLPSRVAAIPIAAAATDGPDSGPGATTGIVEQAVAVLDSERPSRSAPPARSGSRAAAPTVDAPVTQLRKQANDLVEQILALTGEQPKVDAPMPSSRRDFRTEPSFAAPAPELVVEPAPVLSPAGPVAPGTTAQIRISLVNEDQQDAQIAFFSTDLIGGDGACISAEHLSCQPLELALAPGKTGEVIVRVVVPAQTPCGVYSGLLRASRLDYLHAVVVVQVETV